MNQCDPVSCVDKNGLSRRHLFLFHKDNDHAGGLNHPEVHLLSMVPIHLRLKKGRIQNPAFFLFPVQELQLLLFLPALSCRLLKRQHYRLQFLYNIYFFTHLQDASLFIQIIPCAESVAQSMCGVPVSPDVDVNTAGLDEEMRPFPEDVSRPLLRRREVHVSSVLSPFV
ncbi:MAG: hypothetical protein PWQ99_1185 [Clostridia bacterium]|nr:hypothetical protein [Clostridia bacterium]